VPASPYHHVPKEYRCPVSIETGPSDKENTENGLMFLSLPLLLLPPPGMPGEPLAPIAKHVGTISCQSVRGIKETKVIGICLLELRFQDVGFCGNALVHNRVRDDLVLGSLVVREFSKLVNFMPVRSLTIFLCTRHVSGDA
jgi:hypothetical protein